MNDRYLFKAKRINDGKWIVGDLMNFTDGRIGISKISDEWGFYECEKDTLCQCTGLKDKNGTLIFENDIVCHKYYEDKEPKKVGVVGFGDFNCSCCHGVYGWHFGDEDIRDVGSYSVIGNIFDNPELLEVE